LAIVLLCGDYAANLQSNRYPDMKFRNFFAAPLVASLAVSCAPQSGDDYDVSNPYSAPDYVDEDGSPYQPNDVNPTYDAPAVYEDTTPAYSEPSQPAAQPKVHTVVRGDTLWGLSRKYGVSIDTIKRANNLKSDVAVLGTKLVIPAQ